MLSMILQVGGLANLFIGIAVIANSESFDTDRKEGNFVFWYQ